MLKTDLFEEAHGTGLLHVFSGQGRTLIGIEISHRVARRAVSRNPASGGICGDTLRLPFRRHSFHLVISTSTLDHFQKRSDIQSALQEIHRILEPGGNLFLTLDNLSKQLKVGNEATGMMVTVLEEAGLLVRTADEPPAYLPGHALETLQLQAIVDVVREAGETTYLSPRKLPAEHNVDALYDGMETAIDAALAGRTLRDLSLPKADAE